MDINLKNWYEIEDHYRDKLPSGSFISEINKNSGYGYIIIRKDQVIQSSDLLPNTHIHQKEGRIHLAHNIKV